MVRNCIVVAGLSFAICPELRGFQFPYNGARQSRSRFFLQAKNKDEEPGRGWFSNYKFGDLSKSVVNSITGKEEYEFGDISRWMDQRAKSAVNELTGKDEYRFGDLSRFADATIKEKLNNFTGQEEYQVGDVSKEILRRVAAGDYKLEDILLLCKVLASFGIGLAPVASALPAKLLLDLLNVSLGQEIGGRLLEALAVSVDQRFKETLTGDADYKMGDVTKSAILNFVGKDETSSYEFGDITKTIAKQLEDNNAESKKFGVAEPKAGKGSIVLEPKLVAELEDWDLQRKNSVMKEET